MLFADSKMIEETGTRFLAALKTFKKRAVFSSSTDDTSAKGEKSDDSTHELQKAFFFAYHGPIVCRTI